MLPGTRRRLSPLRVCARGYLRWMYVRECPRYMCTCVRLSPLCARAGRGGTNTRCVDVLVGVVQRCPLVLSLSKLWLRSIACLSNQYAFIRSTSTIDICTSGTTMETLALRGAWWMVCGSLAACQERFRSTTESVTVMLAKSCVVFSIFFNNCCFWNRTLHNNAPVSGNMDARCVAGGSSTF